ncbi:MAG: cysteine desulfurase family protein [Coriobacteriia bacterium]|nr:cysteine desulfurase family protein [Coriobacteriia bacterium]
MPSLDSSVYLDNAATTRMPDEILESLYFHLDKNFGNANTKYKLGSFAHDFLEASRQTIAELIGARREQIFFTSGATESNNWVFMNALHHMRATGKNKVLCSSIEHESVIEPLRHLERLQLIEVESVEVNTEGLVEVDTLRSHLDERVGLVSIIHANNELGTIQDIQTLARMCHENESHFHSDCVQSVGHIPLDVRELDLDFMSASAHKFHGPKGVGFLYVKDPRSLVPMMHGGGQEQGMRSGTQNVPYIVAMAEALQWSLEQEKSFTEDFETWQNYLFSYLSSQLDGCTITGSQKSRLNHLASFVIDGVDTETLLVLLDQAGICVSAGSACSSGKLELSHVLRALGYDPSRARGALRISYSYLNTFDEIRYAAEEIVRAVKLCRNFSGTME